jgi:hypothetical protein
MFRAYGFMNLFIFIIYRRLSLFSFLWPFVRFFLSFVLCFVPSFLTTPFFCSLYVSFSTLCHKVKIPHVIVAFEQLIAANLEH